MNCTSRAMLLIATVASCFFSAAQTTNVYTSSTTWTVPSGVNSISIKVYGGAGGLGGKDCGAGCTNAAAGPVGYIIASYNVTPGDVVGIYPGGKGADGANSASGTGGGAGGIASYNTSYNGGRGGHAGGSGSSGGGGGGGAASIITINAAIKMVAGGAGGGGGMANVANSGLPGSATTSSNGTNTGGTGTSTPGASDGGGGGGGGGGQFGSNGGNIYSVGAETAGEGGFRGGNSISGATSTPTDGSIAWTTGGRIEITYTSTLPVTWLEFAAQKNGNQIQLNWSTTTEQNAKEFEVQKSTNGRDWSGIGNIPAAGNSTASFHYSFTDAKPFTGLNFYRLLQRDLDLRVSYSKVVLFDWAHPGKGQRVYPNPTPTGIVNLYLDKRSAVHLFNSSGHKLSEWEFDAGLHTLNLSNRPKGMYYIKTPAGEIRLLWK